MGRLQIVGTDTYSYSDSVDRHDFLKTLVEACQKTGFEVRAYCLMGNHFHSVVDWMAQRLERGIRKSAASPLHHWDRQKQAEGNRPTRGKTRV